MSQFFQFEDYTRVVLNLPTHTPHEKLAATEIIERFKTAYYGSTYTSTNQSIFTGAWLNTDVNPPVPEEDSIAFLIIDMPYSIAKHARQIGVAMDTIRLYSFWRYYLAGAPQAEIWITATPIVVRLTFTHPASASPRSVVPATIV